MHKRLIGKVSGRVQGVMYRDATARSARMLGLVGFVQNQDDGTVRIVAEGEASKLNALLPYLKKGSFFSKVNTIEETWSEATGEFTDFQIRFRNFSDRF